MRLNPVRSAAAVLVALLLLNFMNATLQNVLVAAVAESPPVDAAAYIAVRDRPGVLVASLVSNLFAATLVGYVLARIAGVLEVRHGMAAAAVITLVYGVQFAGNNPMLPPVWARIGTLIVTAPALIAGAAIRGEARRAREEAAAAPPKETS